MTQQKGLMNIVYKPFSGLHKLPMSSMYFANKNGESTEPWRTPKSTLNSSDRWSSHFYEYRINSHKINIVHSLKTPFLIWRWTTVSVYILIAVGEWCICTRPYSPSTPKKTVANTLCSKKRRTFLWPNSSRFSQFFHPHTLWENLH